MLINDRKIANSVHSRLGSNRDDNVQKRTENISNNNTTRSDSDGGTTLSDILHKDTSSSSSLFHTIYPSTNVNYNEICRNVRNVVTPVCINRNIAESEGHCANFLVWQRAASCTSCGYSQSFQRCSEKLITSSLQGKSNKFGDCDRSFAINRCGVPITKYMPKNCYYPTSTVSESHFPHSRNDPTTKYFCTEVIQKNDRSRNPCICKYEQGLEGDSDLRSQSSSRNYLCSYTNPACNDQSICRPIYFCKALDNIHPVIMPPDYTEDKQYHSLSSTCPAKYKDPISHFNIYPSMSDAPKLCVDRIQTKTKSKYKIKPVERKKNDALNLLNTSKKSDRSDFSMGFKSNENALNDEANNFFKNSQQAGLMLMVGSKNRGDPQIENEILLGLLLEFIFREINSALKVTIIAEMLELYGKMKGKKGYSEDVVNNLRKQLRNELRGGKDHLTELSLQLAKGLVDLTNEFSSSEIYNAENMRSRTQKRNVDGTSFTSDIETNTEPGALKEHKGVNVGMNDFNVLQKNKEGIDSGRETSLVHGGGKNAYEVINTDDVKKGFEGYVKERAASTEVTIEIAITISKQISVERDQPEYETKVILDDKGRSEFENRIASDEKDQPEYQTEPISNDKEQLGLLNRALSDENEQPIYQDREISDNKEQPSNQIRKISADKEQPSYQNRKLSADKDQPNYQNKKISGDKDQPSYQNKKNSADKEQPSYQNKEISADNEQPSYQNRKISADEEQPSYHNKKISADKEQSSYQNRKISADKEQSSYQNRKISADKEQPSYQNKEISADNEQPSYQNRKISADKEQPSYQNKEISADKEQPSYQNKEISADKEEPIYQNRKISTDKEQPEYQSRAISTDKEPPEYQSRAISTDKERPGHKIQPIATNDMGSGPGGPSIKNVYHISDIEELHTKTDISITDGIQTSISVTIDNRKADVVQTDDVYEKNTDLTRANNQKENRNVEIGENIQVNYTENIDDQVMAISMTVRTRSSSEDSDGQNNVASTNDIINTIGINIKLSTFSEENGEDEANGKETTTTGIMISQVISQGGIPNRSKESKNKNKEDGSEWTGKYQKDDKPSFIERSMVLGLTNKDKGVRKPSCSRFRSGVNSRFIFDKYEKRKCREMKLMPGSAVYRSLGLNKDTATRRLCIPKVPQRSGVPCPIQHFGQGSQVSTVASTCKNNICSRFHVQSPCQVFCGMSPYDCNKRIFQTNNFFEPKNKLCSPYICTNRGRMWCTVPGQYNSKCAPMNFGRIISQNR